MYLEEQVANLENITTEHGRQIEMVADGLASLTTRVDRGFVEMREEFQKVDQRLNQIDQRLDQMDRRFEQIDEHFNQVNEQFKQVNQQFLEVHGVLRELVTLVKNKN